MKLYRINIIKQNNILSMNYFFVIRSIISFDKVLYEIKINI